MEAMPTPYQKRPFPAHWGPGEIPGSMVLRPRPDSGFLGCHWPGQDGKVYAMRAGHAPDTLYPTFDDPASARAYVEAPYRVEHDRKEETRAIRHDAAEKRRIATLEKVQAREAAREAAPKKNDKKWLILDDGGAEVGHVFRKDRHGAVTGAQSLLGVRDLPAGFRVVVAQAVAAGVQDRTLKTESMR